MKKVITSLIIFILAISIVSTIYAAITANVSLIVSNDKVKPGNTFSVKINAKDINAGTDGLRGVQLKVNYDKNVLETLTSDSIKGYSGLTANYNESAKGNILLAIGMGQTGITEDSDFVEVTFKVKENAEHKDTTVTFENIEVFNTEKLNVGEKSVTVNITDDVENNPEEEKPTPTPTATPEGGSESTPTPSTKPGETNNTPIPTATAKPNNTENKNNVPVTNINTNTSTGSGTTNKGNTSSGSNIKGSTTSSSSLPKAGIGSTIAILTIVVLVIGTVAYINLRKYREI